jgi:hypothetical protein
VPRFRGFLRRQIPTISLSLKASTYPSLFFFFNRKGHLHEAISIIHFHRLQHDVHTEFLGLLKARFAKYSWLFGDLYF